MRKTVAALLGAVVTWALLGAVGIRVGYGKEKAPRVDPSDPTLRLFDFLDSTRNGKLEDFFTLADVYTEQGKEFQRVVRVDYDKSRAFGKLRIWVRSVAKMAPEQLETYTPKQVYDFGEVDLEKFVKTEAGEFGKQGDIYLRGDADNPLATSPIAEGARKSYQMLVAQYLLPALQKK
jgi:hypothetical protein